MILHYRVWGEACVEYQLQGDILVNSGGYRAPIGAASWAEFTHLPQDCPALNILGEELARAYGLVLDDERKLKTKRVIQ